MARETCLAFPGVGQGTGDRADMTPRQRSQNSGATVGTGHAKKTGLRKKGPSEAGVGDLKRPPPPPPHPEAFSKPQAEPYCRSQAKFNF